MMAQRNTDDEPYSATAHPSPIGLFADLHNVALLRSSFLFFSLLSPTPIKALLAGTWKQTRWAPSKRGAVVSNAVLRCLVGYGDAQRLVRVR